MNKFFIRLHAFVIICKINISQKVELITQLRSCRTCYPRFCHVVTIKWLLMWNKHSRNGNLIGFQCLTIRRFFNHPQRPIFRVPNVFNKSLFIRNFTIFVKTKKTVKFYSHTLSFSLSRQLKHKFQKSLPLLKIGKCVLN